MRFLLCDGHSVQGLAQARPTIYQICILSFVCERSYFVAQAGLEHKVLSLPLPEWYFPNSFTYVLMQAPPRREDMMKKRLSPIHGVRQCTECLDNHPRS